MQTVKKGLTRRKLVQGLASVSAVSAAPVLIGKDRLQMEGLVGDIRAANAEADAQQAVEAVLREALARPGRVLEAMGEPRQVGLSPIFHAEDLTILNIVWPPWMMLPAHNHLMWATIGIYTGREDNIIWQRRGGGGVEAAGAASLSAGDVFSLPHDAIHSVTNPIPRLTAAIHVYGGDFFAAERSEWDPETLSEHPQDFEAVQELFRRTQRRFQAVPPA